MGPGYDGRPPRLGEPEPGEAGTGRLQLGHGEKEEQREAAASLHADWTPRVRAGAKLAYAGTLRHAGDKPEWMCTHAHPGRDEAVACALAQLGSTSPGPASPALPEPEPLPASGAPMERVWTEPDRDHPADTDLVIQRGQFTDRIRMTPADEEKILAALGEFVDTEKVIVYLEQVSLCREAVAGGEDRRQAEIARNDIAAVERVSEMLKGDDL